MQFSTFFDQLAWQPTYTHATPLNTYLFSGARFAVVYLNQHASSHQWHGSVLRGVSKVTEAAFYPLNAALALLEGSAALGVGSVEAGLHLLTGARFEYWQRRTLKTLAYSVNCYANAIIQLVLLFKGGLSKAHYQTALLNQGSYLFSAGAIQLLAGNFFDRIAARNLAEDPILGQVSPAFVRTVYLFLQQAPHALKEIVKALICDFSQERPLDRQVLGNLAFSHLSSPQSLQRFFEAHPEHEVTLRSVDIAALRNFDFSQLYRDDFRQQLVRMSLDFLRGEHLRGDQHPEPVAPAEEDGGEAVISGNQSQDNAYRNKLQEYVKRAVREIYQTPTLAAHFDTEEESGQEALENFYAGVYLPLANYVQLKELESPLACPAIFGNRELASYQERKQKLEAAQRELQSLSTLDKEILIQKLLKVSDFDVSGKGSSPEAEERIQHLFKEISKLAGEIHQGKLMSQLTINLEEVDQLPSAQNLFQKAYQEAIQELQV